MALDELVDDLDNSALPEQDVDVSTPEFQVRKEGWKAYLSSMNEKMKDPAVKAAMMQTGIGLMRSQGPNETGWDTVSNALAGGVSTLQQMRQMERQQKLQQEDRAAKQQQQQFENKMKETDSSRAGRQTDAYVENIKTQTETSRSTQERMRDQLEETKRHNKAVESTAATRASNVGKTGNTSADIYKIQALAGHYMQNEGLDETTAKARAVLALKAGAAGQTPAQAAKTIYLEKVKAYNNSIEALQSPLTPEKSKMLLQEAMSDAQLLQSINTTGNAQGNPAESVMFQGGNGVGAAGAADPDIQNTVNNWRAKGYTKEQIKSGLIKLGQNPVLYGVQ